RAVAEKEQGDVHGRVDHASLGVSLHEVGYCLSRSGEFAAARPWFERAVARQSRATCTDASITRASASACTKSALACRAPGSSARRGHGSNAPLPRQSRATCTDASI